MNFRVSVNYRPSHMCCETRPWCLRTYCVAFGSSSHRRQGAKFIGHRTDHVPGPREACFFVPPPNPGVVSLYLEFNRETELQGTYLQERVQPFYLFQKIFVGVECLHLRLCFHSLELTEAIALEPENAQAGVLLEVLDLSNTLSRDKTCHRTRRSKSAFESGVRSP